MTNLLESPYNIIVFILLAVVAVWVILKSISILFKLITLLVIAAVLYVLYGYYPHEVLIAGSIIVAFMVVIWLVKGLFKKDK